jgi:hypothetical protein
MFRTTRIVYITLFLLWSQALVNGAEVQVANVNPQCHGTNCPPASQQALTKKEGANNFSPTPVQLLLAGVGLIALRITLKKHFPAKEK